LILENSEIIKNLELAIDKLPERDKLIMYLYYVDEMNLKEIGEILNVSESRISQIMSSTVKNLKATMNKQQS
jgi:RNA polymerase sigma factor for flagellar operon FliA